MACSCHFSFVIKHALQPIEKKSHVFRSPLTESHYLLSASVFLLPYFPSGERLQTTLSLLFEGHCRVPDHRPLGNAKGLPTFVPGVFF